MAQAVRKQQKGTDGRAQARSSVPMSERLELAERLERYAHLLDVTRQNIDRNNPNRFPIEFHTKQRWSDELGRIAINLHELSAYFTKPAVAEEPQAESAPAPVEDSSGDPLA